MPEPEIIVINKPEVPAYSAAVLPDCLIYSVQLASGLVITNPAQFPIAPAILAAPILGPSIPLPSQA